MALLNEKGNYLKVSVLEGINLNNGGGIYIRVSKYYNEDERLESENDPYRSECISEIKLTDEQVKLFQDTAYEVLKSFEVKTTNIITPAVIDEETGEVIEEVVEEIITHPYGDMTDC